jgi:hypothetical protein
LNERFIEKHTLLICVQDRSRFRRSKQILRSDKKSVYAEEDRMKFRIPVIWLSAVLSFCCTSQLCGADVALKGGHPRLILTENRLVELQKLAETDALLNKCVKDVLTRADGYCGKDTLEYKKIGPRLLSVSRECMNRVYALGLAWRWTGQEKYAVKCKENLLAVCAFADWNPSHFLDTAEMSHAVGVGYDWLYDWLDDETRSVIRQGLIRNGLDEAIKAYKDNGHWFTGSQYNWNQVCNGGLVAGALAIADEEPKYADVIIPGAVKSFPRALASYAPDGSWGEGCGYWHYATRYTAYGIAALQTATGDDFGLLDRDGLRKAAYFPIYMAGPTGMYLNFADVGENSRRGTIPCMFWLSQVYDNALFADSERRQIQKHRAGPEHLIWYRPKPEKVEARTLDRFFGGPVEVAVFRSEWDNPEALFVGIKAGYNQVNHGHLDLANFELDALGQRWARDLGSDDYNLPGYWQGGTGGKRWTYYRLNSESHNVLLVAGKGQDPLAEAKITRFESAEAAGFAIVDLTSAYPEFSKKTLRGLSLTAGRRAVLVQDELEIEKPCEVLWGMTTDAEIELKGTTALLKLGGRELLAKILSPAGAAFSSGSAEQPAPDRQNKGVRRLIIKHDAQQGPMRLSVLLSPLWTRDDYVRAVDIEALSNWK